MKGCGIMAGSDRRIDPFSSKKPPERRKKADWVTRTVTITALFAWALTITALILWRYATPPGTNIFAEYVGAGGVGRRATGVNVTYMRTALTSLVISFFICLTGFFANLTRLKRKHDRYNKSVIILGIASFIGSILFLVINIRQGIL